MGSTADKSQCGRAGEDHLGVNAGRRWLYKEWNGKQQERFICVLMHRNGGCIKKMEW